MKKIHFTTILFSLVLLFSGCEKFTDLQPKGKNLLDRVSDLDLLLNYWYGRLSVLRAEEAAILINDTYPRERIANLIANPTKTLNSVLITWDEETDRAALTASSDAYSTFYSIIGKIANPVLLQIDHASGDKVLAKHLKAEAYVLRAYFHYLAVNFFAKAYDPETAATDPGIPYAREHDLLSVHNQKYTVQKVYDLILEDLHAALELNSLPDKPINIMRVGKSFAYAALAKVYMSMRKFDEAYTAAGNALAVNNTIYDHRPLSTFRRPDMSCPEDLFYATANYLLLIGLTPELTSSYESGSVFYNKVGKMNAQGPASFGLPIHVLFSNATYLNGSGLTTVDMYLVQAECKIRSGAVSEAMGILNHVREYRVDPKTYAPLEAANATEAFNILKGIVRQENWYGCKRFINLKRWNTEDAYKETIRKTLLGVDYELKPDSPLWIFPFPQNATAFNPHLTQNYD